MDCLVVIVSLALLFALAAPGSFASDIILQNDTLQITFSRETGGITAITSQAPAHDFIEAPAAKPMLWRVVLHDPSGKAVMMDNSSVSAPAAAYRRGDRKLVLRWEKIPIPNDSGALSVTVDASIKPTDSRALMRITVHNSSSHFGIWQVDFPVISSLGHPSEAAVAVPRSNWGILYRQPAEALEGTYPSAAWPMQFCLLNEGETGLYLAAQDPHAWFKQFNYKVGGEYALTTYAENMGIPHNSFNAPYTFAIGVYHGNWIEGCHIYRAWALRQPWASRGKLIRRQDVPIRFKRVAAWLQDNGASSTVVPDMEKFARDIGAPVAVHWYNWHQIPFDTHYPDYFPSKPGFAEGVKALVQHKMVVMPYINGRLWDSENPDFEQARPYATKNENGGLNIEIYGSGAKLAVMCPSTQFWQDKVFSIVRRLVLEKHINAIYIDQISSAAPRFCFDPSHHHPLGAGDWWVQSYCRMLNKIKTWCHQDGRDVAITSENNAEPYMADLDGFLIWNPREPDEIPMDAVVYSGYTIYFSTPITLNDGDTSFALAEGRDFLWGAQLGWMGPALMQPSNHAKIAYLSTLARAREMALNYLLYGELLGFLPPEKKAPLLTGTWRGWGGEPVPVRLPAVMNAVWRGVNGTIGVVITNTDTEPHPFTVIFNGSEWGLERADRLTITLKSPDGMSQQEEVAGNHFTKTLDLAGRSVVILSVRPHYKR